MTPRPVRLLLLALVAGAAGGVATTLVSRAAGGGAGSGAEVRAYILDHPEILDEAATRLQQRAAAQAIAAVRPALEQPFAGAWAGAARPAVTLVMFTDYACGYCRASVADVDRLIAARPALRVVWRELPVLGPPSVAAARVALVAAKEGRYPAFHRALFAAGRPDERALDAAARAGGLSQAVLAAAATAPDVAREIEANLALAGRIGVAGTPAFVVGDRLLSGAVGYDALVHAVDAATG